MRNINPKKLKKYALCLLVAFFAIVSGLTVSSNYLNHKEVQYTLNKSSKVIFSSFDVNAETLNKAFDDNQIEFTSISDGVYALNTDSAEQFENVISSTGITDFTLNEDISFIICDNENIEETNEVNEFSDLTEKLPDGYTWKQLAEERGQKLVAVIDTGVSKAYAIHSENFTDDSDEDINGHGTMMAYNIAKYANGKAMILSLKAMNDNGNGYMSNVIKAIRAAIDYDVDVINLSISAVDNGGTQIFKSIVQEAIDKGITVVASAGNYGTTSKNYIPACIEDVITVGAMKMNDSGEYERVESSNYFADCYEEAGTTSVAAAVFTGKFINGSSVENEIKESDLVNEGNLPSIKDIIIDRINNADNSTDNIEKNTVETYASNDQNSNGKTNFQTQGATYNVRFIIKDPNGNENSSIGSLLLGAKYANVGGTSLLDDSSYVGSFNKNYTQVNANEGAYLTVQDFRLNDGYVIKQLTVTGTSYKLDTDGGLWDNKANCSGTTKLYPTWNAAKTAYGYGIKINSNLTITLETSWATATVNASPHKFTDGQTTKTFSASSGQTYVKPNDYISTDTLPSYSITFDANGGSNDQTLYAKRMPKWKVDSTSYPSDYDYIFSDSFYYYFKSSTGSGTTLFHNNTSSNVSISSYNTKGYITSLPSNPTKEGYTFNGWYDRATSGNKKSISTSIAYSSNTTYYAHWTANTYTISYNGNGNTGGSTASSTHTYDQSKALTANGFTREGYTFAGWTTNADGSGNSYSNGQQVKNLATSGTVTLYAKWTANTYTISYNGNGNTGGSTASSTHTYNEEKALTANGFTRTGYSFAGWNTNANGSGKFYADKASVKNLSSTNGDTVTLYAQWTPHTYKVNFDSNGGYDVRNNASRKISSTVATYESNYETQQGGFSQETWTYDDKTSANNSIKNKVQSGSFFWPGHTFLGWATNPDATSPEFSTTKNIDNAAYPGSNGGSRTLYAVWRANSITTKIYPTGVNGDGTWNAVSWVASDNSWSNNGNYNNGYTAGRGGVQTINGYWGDLIKLGPATPNDRTATISYNANTSDSVSGMRTSDTVEWVFNRWTKDSGNLGILEKNNANSRTKAQIQAGGQIESQGSFSYYVVQSSNNDSVSANYYFTTVQLPILSRNGYTFLGWYYDADCTQKAGNGGQRYRAFKTETLYARWQKNTYEYADNGSVFMQDDDSTDKNVYLRKLDADTFEPLKSVTVGGETYGFEICVYQNNASGPLVARLNTAEGLYNGSGTKIQGTNGADSLGFYNITSLLTQGRTYLVRETSAAPGYTYDEDQTFTYTGNERISITVEDSQIGISADVIEEEIVFKIDPYGRKVANATFELKDTTNGKVMGTFTTNERGVFPVTYDEYGNVIDGLLKYVSPRHTYTLTETVVPEGYSTAPVITFTVPRDGIVQQIKITEAVKTTTLQIKKTNSDDVGLANAKFQLFMKDKDGNLIKCYMDSTTKAWVADETVANATPMIATTGDDGIATFSNIPIRASFTGIEPDYTKSYYLKEIEAPQGYNLLPEIFEIRIPDNGETSYLYTVKDESIVLTLEAGGSGVTPTVFTGGLLMVFAITLAYFRKIKQD